MAGKNTVLKLQDKVKDNEMDMSMMNLIEVPIREMKRFNRVTHLDLSNNQLRELSIEFAPTFFQLTFLDLSRNRLFSLPENIGVMSKLVHFDLYKNEITRLPLSMSNMNKLQWLDLKDNPLVESLAKVCGNCSNKHECRKCAKDLVLFMKQLDRHVNSQTTAESNQDMIEEEEDVLPSSVAMKQISSKMARNDSESDESDDTTVSNTRRHGKNAKSKKSNVKSKKKGTAESSSSSRTGTRFNDSLSESLTIPNKKTGSQFSFLSILKRLMAGILFTLFLAINGLLLLSLMVESAALQVFLTNTLGLPGVANILVPTHVRFQKWVQMGYSPHNLPFYKSDTLSSIWSSFESAWKGIVG